MRTAKIAADAAPFKIDPKTIHDRNHLLRLTEPIRSWSRLLTGMRGPSAKARAIRHAVWGLARGATARTVVGEHTLVELAITWVARGARVGLHTAWSAVRYVTDAVGRRLVPGHAEAVGANLRKLRDGQDRHGDHLLVRSIDVVRAEEEIDRLIAGGGFEAPARATGEDPADWRIVEGLRLDPVQGTGVCRCPWHDDRKPSMVIREDRGSVTGIGTCLVCESNGHRLTMFWRRRADGGIEGRRSGASRTEATPYEPCFDPRSTEGIGGVPDPLWVTGPRSCSTAGTPKVEVGWVTTRVQRGERERGRSRTSGAADLWSLLRRHDATARSPETAERELWARIATDDGVIDPRLEFPDRYVTANPQRSRAWIPRGFRSHGREIELWVASAWEEASVEVVPIDLDGISIPSAGLNEIRRMGRSVADRLVNDPDLSGAVSIQRTGPNGLQALIRLREARDPSWWRSGGREVAERAAAVVLEEARRVGITDGAVDRSVWHSGARIRLPGLRCAKNGLPWIARVAFQTPWDRKS